MRKDATRVEIPALMQCMIDLKPTRKECEVYIDRKIDVTELVNYITDLKQKGIHYTYFQAFLTAIAKVMYNRPRLNYFVANRHMYTHNDITLSFVAKIALEDKSDELMLVVPVEENDNLQTLAAKATDLVTTLRNTKPDKTGANGAAEALGKLPNIIRVPIFWLMKKLGERGMLPKSLTDNNIYFTSMIISNLGSIRCGAIYHNIADFGSCSSLATIGEIENEMRTNDDGTQELRKVCHFGVTLDERIGDGFYFARSIALMAHILQHPETLNDPVSTKIDF